jgi:hypothetical protein
VALPEGAEVWKSRRNGVMTPIVKRTRHGETIFTSNPSLAARALVTWATEVHGHSLHWIERLENGFVKVDIPGLTRITYARENINEI